MGPQQCSVDCSLMEMKGAVGKEMWEDKLLAYMKIQKLKKSGKEKLNQNGSQTFQEGVLTWSTKSGLETRFPTIAEKLKDAGYATHMLGK